MADINGTENDDLIEGTDQSDLIQARGGNDTVSAAAGDDWIRPGLGDDEIYGGFGNDILQYEGVYDGVVLNNTSSTRDGIPAYSAQSSDGLNRDTFVSVENFHLSHGDDVFYTDTYSYVFMRSGNDTAYIDDAEAYIIPGSGADVIVSDAFASALSYFDYGFDSFGNGDATITSGINAVYDGSSSSLLSGQVTDGWGYTDTFSGIEEIRGTQLADRFQGAGRLELTFLGGQGNDEILGGNGNDYLYGGMHDDTLVGNSGDDYLEGGSGQNTLVGGDGSDQFSLNSSGFAEISDYEAGELIWIEPNNDFDIQEITVDDLNLSYSSASNTTQISIDHSEGSTALADVTGQWFLDNVLFGDHLGLSLTNDSTREATTRHQFTSPDQITASSEIYAYSFDGYTFNEDENTEWTSGFEGKLVYYGSSDLEFTSVYNKNIEGAQTYITSGELFDIRLNGQSLLHDLWMNLDYQEITDVELGSPSNVSRVAYLTTSSRYWDYVENQPKLNEQTHLFNIGGTPLFSSPLNQEEVLNTVELIITPGNGYQTNTLANVDVIMSDLVAGERVTDIPGYRDNARTPYEQSLDGEVVQYDLTGFSFFEDETIEDSDFGDRLIGDPMSATLTVIGSPDLTGLSEAITLGSDASPFVDVLEDTRLLEGEIYEVFVNGIPLKDYTDGSMELSLERITSQHTHKFLINHICL